MSEHIETAEAASQSTAVRAPGHEAASGSVPEPQPRVTVQDVLVEEVSIDGMCGVY